jgi:ribose/xylose/arabinose/galactoside ABC-type transport system permease subunit
MPSLTPARSPLWQGLPGGPGVRARLQSALVLIIVLAIALVTSPRASDGSLVFLDPGNLTDVLRQVSVIGILALGMTFVILTAGIDLSVGSLLALSSSAVALILTRSVFPWPTAWAIENSTMAVRCAPGCR